MSKKKMCANCKHSDKPFKIGNMTYTICMHPQYSEEKMIAGEQHPYDALKAFWESCENFKAKKKTDEKDNT